MVSITPPPPSNRLASTPGSAPAPSDAPRSDGVTAPISAVTVSTLARQLSEAATRAHTRDAHLDRFDLAQKATERLGSITGDRYFASKAQHNAEIPYTDDPQRLARARQATGFVNGAAGNPFKGMPRDQLALITYDDSGAFTVNERRAAWEESSRQEEAWRKGAVAQAMNEYDRTGKLTHFFTQVLDHYNGLSGIEQAQYPQDYASQLQEMIDLDFNYATHQAEGKGATVRDLIEQVTAARGGGPI